MILASREEAQRIDLLSTQKHGLPSSQLMENAGEASADHIWRFFEAEARKGFSVLVGNGNNGGDALVAARHLEAKGGRLRQLILKSKTGSDLFERQLQHFSGRPEVLEASELSVDFAIQGHVLIDGWYGIGLNRPLTDLDLKVIRATQNHSGHIVCLDLPSGIDCDTGWDWGSAIRATHTLTFGVSKPGLHLNRGYSCAGDLFVLNIGYPEELVRAEAKTFQLYRGQEAVKDLPVRSNIGHKANHGRVLILAGSSGKWGAAILCGRSASRSGVGFVHVMSTEEPQEVLRQSPEFLCSRWDDSTDLEAFDAIVVGPGLGVNPKTQDILLKLAQTHRPVVADADALTVLANEQIRIPEHWLITPHMGEFSRFLPLTTDQIEFHRWKALEMFWEQQACAVLMKGFHSQFCRKVPDRQVSIIEAGNSALSKAGSGDVLAGLVGGFLAQGLSLRQASCLGAYVHGRAADLYIRDKGHPATLLVSELFEEIPRVFRELSTQAI